MAIITLTTDFGTRDYFAAALKGALLKEHAPAVVVDISHEITAYDIEEAAFVVRNAFPHFPSGSVHIVSVNTAIKSENRYLVAEARGHYFIAADNGLFSLLFENHRLDGVHEIEIPAVYDEPLFPEIDFFVRSAAHLARGGKMGLLGRQVNSFRELESKKPEVLPDQIRGRVIYIDRFGNAVTNITKRLFEETRNERSFEIILGRTGNTPIKRIAQNYLEGGESTGRELALFNSAGLLEIAMTYGDPLTRGGASSLLGLDKKTEITTIFK